MNFAVHKDCIGCGGKGVNVSTFICACAQLITICPVKRVFFTGQYFHGTTIY